MRERSKKKTLTKRQVVDIVTKLVGLTGKKTQEVIQVFLDSIASHLLEGSRLEFRDFGTFEPVVRQAKQGRDLQNNRPLEIPAYTTVKFTPGKKLRAGLSKAGVESDAKAEFNAEAQRKRSKKRSEKIKKRILTTEKDEGEEVGEEKL